MTNGRARTHGYDEFPLMLTVLDLRGSIGDLDAAFARSDVVDDEVTRAVRDVIADVRARGDAALRELTRRFDGCDIDDPRVAGEAVAAALERTPSEVRAALEYAAGEITAYHEAQRAPEVAFERDGVRVRERVVPVDRAGCYVPGGRAAYPSSVLMTAIPARVAGVPEVVLCMPPGSTGDPPDAALAAAALAGVDEVYRIGGAQAIAAMAYGTESVRPVDVVVGPGSAHVTAAKREVAGVVGIESLAGPSEVVVVADESADPELVAIDLVAQAEHGPGGTAVVVCWSSSVAEAVIEAVARRTAAAPRRAEIESTLRGGGRAVLVDGPTQALEVVNAIAPEHVELLTQDAEVLAGEVRNAGAVFCGPWAPAAVGDYVAGVNHVLPTARTARFASALRVDDFCKHIHVVSVDEAGLRRIAPYIEALATVEGLDEHARSVALRVERA
ncbi:MAG TPA: histidinol dehydrogenase [Acidimicrobiia bacterium]|jgi:histidinol dehydrogenase